jgi:hypothetical protein
LGKGGKIKRKWRIIPRKLWSRKGKLTRIWFKRVVRGTFFGMRFSPYPWGEEIEDGNKNDCEQEKAEVE